jgi:hypothetical protein
MKTRREKNRKRRTTRRVFKKILHSRTSRIKMKMKKKVEIGKEELNWRRKKKMKTRERRRGQD